MNALSQPRLTRIAVIGTLVAALGLAGCGRKGGLDLPPGAVVEGDPAVQPAAVPALGPDGRPPMPPPPPPPRRTTPIDFLID